jgi:hypothetical protein
MALNQKAENSGQSSPNFEVRKGVLKIGVEVWDCQK